MIVTLDHRDAAVAARLCALQKASYAIESAIIGYAIPLMFESPEDLARTPETFLGFSDGASLAGALAYETWPDEIEICRLMVHPDHFRRGIGSRLVEEVVKKADGGEIRVSTGADNAPAISLYERLGFAISKQRTLPDGLRLVELRRPASQGRTAPC
jgi:ribosomal protein S18 acetylase RimI-like enzyme